MSSTTSNPASVAACSRQRAMGSVNFTFFMMRPSSSSMCSSPSAPSAPGSRSRTLGASEMVAAHSCSKLGTRPRARGEPLKLSCAPSPCCADDSTPAWPRESCAVSATVVEPDGSNTEDADCVPLGSAPAGGPGRVAPDEAPAPAPPEPPPSALLPFKVPLPPFAPTLVAFHPADAMVYTYNVPSRLPVRITKLACSWRGC